MDPSIAIFVLGSCASFIVFYWVFVRYFSPVRARQDDDRARHFGLKKSSFLDDLRQEAGLRAHTILCAAADQLRNATWDQSSASIDRRMMERLQETRSMLQSLLPRQLTNEFDGIVGMLQSRPSGLGVELDDALERFAKMVSDIAPIPANSRQVQPVVKGRLRRSISSMQMASDPA